MTPQAAGGSARTGSPHPAGSADTTTHGFVRRCALACRVDLADLDVLVDQRGMRNLVLIDQRRDVVWRFPRTEEGCAQLGDAARRLQVLQRYDVPVPRLLNLVPGSLGQGHLMLSRCRGAALDTIDTDALPARSGAALVAGLIDAVARLQAVPVSAWPSPAPGWIGLWQGLLSAASTVPLPPAVRERQIELARAAAAAAVAADIGVVIGLLDWDSATIGDVATDQAALLHGLGQRTAALLRRTAPAWERAEERYQAYVATWPLQWYLWALTSGDVGEQRRGLQSLSG
jgi:aminoglycoside phosphotransferase (APT) family kinase protein